MCGYDPFTIYEQMLEQEYLERMEKEEKEFVKDIKNKSDDELEQLYRDAKEIYDVRMQKKIQEEMNRRHTLWVMYLKNYKMQELFYKAVS